MNPDGLFAVGFVEPSFVIQAGSGSLGFGVEYETAQFHGGKGTSGPRNLLT